MLKPQGYVQVFGNIPKTIEHDSVTCGHCNKVIFVKPGTGSTVYVFYHLEGPPTEEPGAFCRVCMRAVCLPCHEIGTCLPLERQIEQMEATGRLRPRSLA